MSSTEKFRFSEHQGALHVGNVTGELLLSTEEQTELGKYLFEKFHIKEVHGDLFQGIVIAKPIAASSEELSKPFPDRVLPGKVEIAASENEKQYTHYFKRLPEGATHIDVYLILDLFCVVNQGIGHAIKKLLCPGQRHQKSYLQDIKEARNTLNRVIEIEELKQQSSTLLSDILKD